MDIRGSTSLFDDLRSDQAIKPQWRIKPEVSMSSWGYPNRWRVYKWNILFEWMITGGTPILGNPQFFQSKLLVRKRNPVGNRKYQPPEICDIDIHSWLVVTGTMEFYDFPETVGNVIIPTDFHSMIFQRGRAKNHQPDMEHPEWIAGILDGEITMDFRSR